MASYVPSTAIAWAELMIKSMPFTSSVGTKAADSIAQMIWMAAPWRWTIDSLAAVSLTAAAQDFSFTKPADFLYLASAYIFIEPSKSKKELEIVSSIPSAVSMVNFPPDQVAYVSSGGDKFRLSAKTPATLTGTSYLVAQYKKTYTPITSLNVGTAGVLGMPDEWSHVFEQGILWKAYQYGDDDRAGSTQVTNDGKIAYTGQLGVFMAALEEMRRAEKLLFKFPGVEVSRG